MADTKRDVKVTLNIDLGDSGKATLAQLKKSLEDTAKAQLSLANSAERNKASMTALANLGAGGFAGRIGHFQSMGEGLSQAGFGRAGAAVGRAAPYLALAGAGLNAAAHAAESYHDPYQTGAQGLRGFARTVVPGGETVLRTVDSFTGRAAAMRETELNAARLAVERESYGRIRQFQQGYTLSQGSAEERATQMQGARTPLLGNVDRMSATGEREYRERARIIPVEKEIMLLKREATIAEKEESIAQGLSNKLVTDQTRLYEQRNQKVRELKDSGPERQQKLQEIADLEKQLQQNAEERIGAAQTLQQAKLRAGTARAQTKEGEIARLQTESGFLEERAVTSAQGATALGGMKKFERLSAVRSMELLDRYGPEMLSPEQIAEARAVDPAKVEGILKRYGAGTEEYGQLAKMPGSTLDARGPDALFKEAAGKADQAGKLRTEMEMEISLAAERAGMEIADSVISAILTIKESARREIQQNEMLGRGYK